MTEHNYIPEGYERIKVVDDLFSFFTTDFAPKANVVLYPRGLSANFDELAEKMAKYFDLQDEEIFIKYSEREKLEEFKEKISDDGMFLALNVILDDMECLYSARVKTHFRLLRNYKIHKDTYTFHVDGLEQDFDRFMVCYNDPVTQFVKNEDVIKINGHDAICRDGAPIYQFKAGDIWKSRVRNKPKSKADDFLDGVLREKEKRAFVHRAQYSKKPRIMVVGDKSVN
ncbi:MAG: hypothetical protein ACRBDI_02895 [Alphaproteobacteria bacterium]